MSRYNNADDILWDLQTTPINVNSLPLQNTNCHVSSSYDNGKASVKVFLEGTKVNESLSKVISSATSNANKSGMNLEIHAKNCEFASPSNSGQPKALGYIDTSPKYLPAPYVDISSRPYSPPTSSPSSCSSRSSSYHSQANDDSAYIFMAVYVVIVIVCVVAALMATSNNESASQPEQPLPVKQSAHKHTEPLATSAKQSLCKVSEAPVTAIHFYTDLLKSPLDAVGDTVLTSSVRLLESLSSASSSIKENLGDAASASSEMMKSIGDATTSLVGTLNNTVGN